MGETDYRLFPMDFNRAVRVESRPDRLTSDAGAVLIREVMERLEITQFLVNGIEDVRDQNQVTHPLAELLNASVLLLAQGWRDQDDADSLRHDPAMRIAVSTRRGSSPLERRPAPDDGRALPKNPEHPDGLASQPTLSRLHGMLAMDRNREVLRDSLLETASRRLKAMRRGRRHRYLTIDVDSLPIEVHGQQPGSKYNGHYHSRIYHPLVASIAETGDLIDARLREGNVHTANGALTFILPLIEKAEQKLCQVASLRIDAGFPEDELLSALEERGTPYVSRVRKNAVLDRMARPHLRIPPGRSSGEPRIWFHEMSYRAEKWTRERRVVLVVQERPGELFPHHFWLITNWTAEAMSAENLLSIYRERGTAEGHMGELMNVLAPALSSSPRKKSHYRNRQPGTSYSSRDSFAINEVRLLLNILAYNVTHAGRLLLESATRQGWSLQRFRELVLRVAGRVVLHSRRVTLAIARTRAHLWKALWSRLRHMRYAET